MAHVVDRESNRDQAINIRVTRDQRALIDQAARLRGKSRSEFMLESAYREAENVLLDQVFFSLTPEAFDRMAAMLDAPPEPGAELQRLLKSQAPWE